MTRPLEVLAVIALAAIALTYPVWSFVVAVRR